MVGVLALYIERQALDGLDVVHGEMPGHVAGAVPFRLSAEGARGHAFGVLERGGAGIIRAMNGDVSGRQRKLDMPAIPSGGNNHLPQIHRRWRSALAQRFATGCWSG